VEFERDAGKLLKGCDFGEDFGRHNALLFQSSKQLEYQRKIHHPIIL
jgi:hypothetical protein